MRSMRGRDSEGVAEREAAVPETQRIAFRIGINLGDIIVEGDDIYGDGVNIAARLEGLAEPGGICIARTSATRSGQARPRLRADGRAPGQEHRRAGHGLSRQLDGRPVAARSAAASALAPRQPRRASCCWPAGGVVAWHRRRPAPQRAGPPEQARAAVAGQALDRGAAVRQPLGRRRHERLADGITEDIITDLSRFRELFVIARNSTFVYKDKPTDVRQIARELGVQYVLEGSLQTDGRAGANHSAAHRCDHRQPCLVGALRPPARRRVRNPGRGDADDRRPARGIARRGREIPTGGARRKPPENLAGYELYVLGLEEKAPLHEGRHGGGQPEGA